MFLPPFANSVYLLRASPICCVVFEVRLRLRQPVGTHAPSRADERLVTRLSPFGES